MPAGRPTNFNKDMADTICAMIAEGASVREIGRTEGMPAARTVFQWLAAHDEFAQQYARAKEAGLEAMADEIMDIADNSQNDWMERNDPDNAGFNAMGEHIQRSRLRIDSRKWLLSKLASKKYGDKLAIGGDQENPIVQVVRHGDE